MKNPSIILIVLFWMSVATSCRQEKCEPVKGELYYPAQELGVLFHNIQMSNIFSDGKSFVDYIPKCDPASILKIYLQQESRSDFNLQEFIDEHFIPYPSHTGKLTGHDTLDMESYLYHQWDNLIRIPDTTSFQGSLLPLPNAYVVPGGRFREVYYWDSYFTMLGLAESEKIDLMKNMVDNFAFLIEKYGHIPNGNRTYYLSRSQPPYFSLMVNLLSDYVTKEETVKYLPALEKEYEFWMSGSQRLDESDSSIRRVVLLDSLVLNRHWDDLPEPRPEAYKADYELAEKAKDRDRNIVYTNLKAAAESGWDFSSRWFEDGQNLSTIRIIEYLPVDLNCLLYNLEQTIADLSQVTGDMQKWSHYTALAQTRKRAINRYFWNEEKGYYVDYDFIRHKPNDQLTAAAASPLFFGIADQEKASKTINAIYENLLFDGGIVTTLNDTGQQWDYPNGWAPLEWIAIKGFLNYGERDLALDIAGRWLKLNKKVYHNTGKMMEKYNVVDTTLFAGGGEYELQDGFGWTNGIDLQILDVFPELQVDVEEPQLQQQ